METRGVIARNAPSRVGTAITPAEFETGAILGSFSRLLDGVIPIYSVTELDEKAGDFDSAFNGRYALVSMFNQLRGGPGDALIRTPVPLDAVQSSKIIQGVGSADTVKLKSAYQSIPEKSPDGDKTGYWITNFARVTLNASAAATATDTVLGLTAVAQVRAGDILAIASSIPQEAKVLSVDEGNREVTLTAGLVQDVALDDVVEVRAFRLKTYRKSPTGKEQAVNIGFDNIALSMEPENVEYYIVNQFQNHPWMAAEDLNSADPLGQSWPPDSTAITYLAGGDRGASPTSADWVDALNDFDSYAPRWMCNVEDSSAAANNGGETYCLNRDDSPIWMPYINKELTLAAYEAQALQYQKSGSPQIQVGVAAERYVPDPVGVGANPKKLIPINAAVIGAWMWTFRNLGFHRVPAGYAVPIIGVTDDEMPEDRFTSEERTRLLEAGLNIAQYIKGKGLIVREFRMFTTENNLGDLWGNVALQRNFVKISLRDSFVGETNKPNGEEGLTKLSQIALQWLRVLYDRGYPPGTAKTKEAFADYTKENEQRTAFEDVVEVKADSTNNPRSALNQGNWLIEVSCAFTGVVDRLLILVRNVVK
jgi:hypothetical protein